MFGLYAAGADLLGVAAEREIWEKRKQAQNITVLLSTEQSAITKRLRRCDHLAHRISCGPGSVVGIATSYGLYGPGIESRWGEIFRTCPDRPWGPPSILYHWYRVFPGGKERPGRDADPSPPSSTVVKKE